MDSHPGLSVSVRSGNGESLLRWVAHGEVDVACCLRLPVPPGVEEERAWPQHLGVVTAPAHPLTQRNKPLRLRDCLDDPLVLVAPDMELRVRVERLDPRLVCHGRPIVETSSVPMVRRLVARGDAVAFLIPDNVAQDVAQGCLAWIGLEDPGARTHSCLYQRTGYSTAVAMGVFLEALEPAVDLVRQRFESLHQTRLQSLAMDAQGGGTQTHAAPGSPRATGAPARRGAKDSLTFDPCLLLPFPCAELPFRHSAPRSCSAWAKARSCRCFH